jgi:malate dehydrogenase (oxaloacetate-decarboxylating)(NADP+)
VLVFSTLSAANAAYKLIGSLSHAEVIGPVLMGMDRPVHVLQRGASQQEILNLATVASVDAQARASVDGHRRFDHT